LIYYYRCVTGKYDKTGGFRGYSGDHHVLFTDIQAAAPSPWESHLLKSPERLASGHDKNRFHKVFANRLFPDAKYSIYMDGNVELVGNDVSLIELMNDTGAPIAFFRHPDGRNLIQEAEACSRLGKFDAHDKLRVDDQLRFYDSEGFDIHAPISANYFIVRRHDNKELDAAMSLWWSHTFEFTKRDQMSLLYCLWKFNLNWTFLDDHFDSSSLRIDRGTHRNGSFKRKFRSALNRIGR
jgi:hypothetical protein